MTNWSKITVEKMLRYLFLLMTVGAGLIALFNLGVYLGIGQEESILRGWVNYGHRSPNPETLPMATGHIKVYNMSQIQFAVVHFENLSDMLRGIPLVYLIVQVLTEFSVVMVFYLLMLIFRSLDQGEIFRANNLNRMRRIAYAVLAFSVFTFLNSNLLAIYIQSSGEQLRSAYPAMTVERIMAGGLIALIILALLKAFKLGTQLQQEQDLTI